MVIFKIALKNKDLHKAFSICGIYHESSAIICSPSYDGKLQKLAHQATSNSCKKRNEWPEMVHDIYLG